MPESRLTKRIGCRSLRGAPAEIFVLCINMLSRRAERYYRHKGTIWWSSFDDRTVCGASTTAECSRGRQPSSSHLNSDVLTARIRHWDRFFLSSLLPRQVYSGFEYSSRSSAKRGPKPGGLIFVSVATPVIFPRVSESSTCLPCRCRSWPAQ